MNKEGRFNFYNSLICSFCDLQIRKGHDCETEVMKAYEKLVSWIKKECPKIDDFELCELIDDLLGLKFDSIVSVLVDLDCLKVDFDKMPPIRQLDFVIPERKE